MSLTAIFAKAASGKAIFGAGLLSGVLSFIVSETLHLDLPVAIALSAFSTFGCAWLASRPKMVSAQSSAHALAVNDWSKLLQEANRMHAEQLEHYRAKNEAERKIQALMRITKHNAFDAYASACWHIQNMEEILKEKGISVPPFKPHTIKELVGEEDRLVLSTLDNGKSA